MGVWGETLGVRAVSACWRAGAIDNRLPPSAKDLPPSAKTCHDLPRAASFSSHPRRSMEPRRNGDLQGRVAMFVTGLVLWHGGSWMGTDIGSAASDSTLENQGEGLRGPATVCHLNLEAWRMKRLGRADGPSSLKIPSLARRARVCGFMVTRGVFNTSPKRERGDPGRGDLSVGHFGGVGDPRRTGPAPNREGFRRGPTTPFAGRATQASCATRLVEHEEHGLPPDGKTVAPWIEPSETRP